MVVTIIVQLQPVSSDTTRKNFIINPGDGTNLIASRLQSNRLIRNRFVFLILTRLQNKNTSLRAGLFKLSPSMTPGQIIAELATGGNHDYWLKIIEGQRLAELPVEFPSDTEGYIFPDSYLIPEDYTVDNIYSLISKNFNEKLTTAKENSTNPDISDRDAVILASLIEREARRLESKQAVAGILLNRLRINMALQVDATVQYARDTRLSPKSYWTPVSRADLAIESPYNSYKQPGLPPGPICNPGFDSLYAVFHPTPSDYLFYITGNDHQMHYARTLEEHNANIAKYLK